MLRLRILKNTESFNLILVAPACSLDLFVSSAHRMCSLQQHDFIYKDIKSKESKYNIIIRQKSKLE